MIPDRKIMIIGGHGKVGQSITKELKNYCLILAGRNEEKMKRFIQKEQLKAEICVMDILHIDFALLQNVGWIIVCVDQENTLLVEYCDKNGIDYMDVTANSEYIDKIRRLELNGTSKILLGIGLAPGLTNLLAEQLLRNPKFGSDIFIVSIQSGKKSLYAWGHDEGRFTGLIAAESAKRMADSTLKKGIMEISDIMTAEEIINNVCFS